MNEGTSLLFTTNYVGRSDDSFSPSFSPDKHQHNYLISARLILNIVPYWLIHNSIKGTQNRKVTCYARERVNKNKLF